MPSHEITKTVNTGSSHANSQDMQLGSLTLAYKAMILPWLLRQFLKLSCKIFKQKKHPWGFFTVIYFQQRIPNLTTNVSTRDHEVACLWGEPQGEQTICWMCTQYRHQV
jgi:hypothetical protein